MSGDDFYDSPQEGAGASDPYYRPNQSTTGDFFGPPPSVPKNVNDPYNASTGAFGSPPSSSYGTQNGYGAISGKISPVPTPPAANNEPSFDNPKENLIAEEPIQRTTSPVAAPAAAPAVPVDQTHYSWYQVEYYRYLFNVDTDEVAQRVRKSVIPWPPNFIEVVRINPDLYGPFWITTTVVFLMAMAGNFGSYLEYAFSHHSNSKEWTYDFSYVSFSALAIYGYNIIIPVALWLTSRFLDIKLSLLDCLCIYGYALVIYVPVAVFSIIPVNFIRWILVGVAGAISTVFLVGNFFKEVRAHIKWGIVILVVLGALHIALALVFKLYFFRIADWEPKNDTMSANPIEFF